MQLSQVWYNDNGGGHFRLKPQAAAVVALSANICQGSHWSGKSRKSGNSVTQCLGAGNIQEYVLTTITSGRTGQGP